MTTKYPVSFLTLSFALLTTSLASQDAPRLPEQKRKAEPKPEPATHRVDFLDLAGTTYVRRESRASSHAASKQNRASIAFDSDGGVVVTWESRRQRHGLTAVYLQRFDAAGRRRGTETSIHTEFQKVQHAPVAAAGDTPWFAWESFDAMREGGVVYLNRGPESQPTRVGTGQTSNATILSRKDGAVVAFVGHDEHGRPAVFLQRFDAKGKSAPAERLAPGRFGSLPSLAATQDGGYVVAWAALTDDGLPDGLAFQRFNRDDKRRGTTVPVRGRDRSGCIEPAVAALANGGIALVWHDRSPNSEYYDVVGQCFDPDGKPSTTHFVISASAHRTSAACVAATPHAGGQLCFAWTQGDGAKDSQDVMARLYDVQGRPLGSAFRVTQQGAGDQALRAASGAQRIAFGPAGELAFAWSGDAELGDDSAVHLTLMLPKGHAQFANARGAETEKLVAVREFPSSNNAEVDASSRPHDPPVFFKHYAQNRGNFRAKAAGDPGFIAITNTGWTPPDPRIAVGPNHLVEMVNGGIAFFRKDGTRTFFQSLVNAGGFWGQQGAQGFVFDPRVLFDAYSGRFVAMAAEHDGNARRGYFCVAVSDDDDPNGVWHKYRIDVTAMARGFFVDYPHMGIDEEAIYISSNNFSGGFSHTTLMLPKAPMLVGGNPGPGKFIRNAATTSGCLAAQRGDVPGGAIMVSTGSATSIELHSFRDPLTTPRLTTVAIAVPRYGAPPRVPQQGTTATLQPVDTRIMQTAVRGKRVYAIHTIGQNGKAVARWYEFDLGNWPTSGSPRLVQSGNIDAGTNVHTFLPGIGVDLYGNVCACFARSSSGEFPSIGRAMRLVSDPLGTMSRRRRAITSPTSYQNQRWGDYSSVVLDPRDQATFWFCHQYATSSNAWNTWIGSVRPQRPTLTADKMQLNAATGDTLTLSLDNPAYANQTYIMVAGWSGTSPGVRLPAAPGIVNLDLNLDTLTNILTANFNTPTFDNFFGRLDAAGKATATFRLPPIPALAGRTVHFAYAQGNTRFDFASETVDVRLQ